MADSILQQTIRWIMIRLPDKIKSALSLDQPIPSDLFLADSLVDPSKSDPLSDVLLSASAEDLDGWYPAPRLRDGTWMLRDGAVLRGCADENPHELGGGCYVALQTDVEKSQPYWTLYDRHDHTVRRITSDNAQEQLRQLLRVDQEATQRNAQNPELLALLQNHEAKALSFFHGLWLPEECCPAPWPEVLRTDTLKRYELTARLCVPDDLRYAYWPHYLLIDPLYEICLNGMPTGRFTRSFDTVFSTPDESILAVKGFVPRWTQVWHIFKDNQWHMIYSRVRSNVTFRYDSDSYKKEAGPELTTVTAMEQNHVEFTLDYLGPERELGLDIPKWVYLPASWAAREITLPTRGNRLVVPLPSNGNDHQK